MKQILSILFLSILLVSCNNSESEGYSISGNVNVPDGTKIFLTELDENGQPKPHDTLEVENGEFKKDLPEVETPNLGFISVEGVTGNMVYIIENEPITMNIDKSNIRATEIDGGIENDLFNTYIEHIRESTGKLEEATKGLQKAFMSQDSVAMQKASQNQQDLNEENKRFKRNMLEENKNHLVAAIILSDMINQKLYSNEEVKDFYASLSEEIKKSPLGTFLGKNINLQSEIAVGSKAPNFSAPSPSGEEIALYDVLGKVTIIDFWASWCKPCRMENPNVVKTYNKYHDKGLNIIGVSLDRPGQKDKWVQAIEEDNLTWNHISNLQFWQEPIAQTYGVRSIPATFILDENGVIVARDLRGEELEAKIAELLGE